MGDRRLEIQHVDVYGEKLKLASKPLNFLPKNKA